MYRIFVISILLLIQAFPFYSQGSSPDDEQIAEARRRVTGAPGSTELPGGSAKVPMVGTKTLPLVEIKINGRGPYKLLVDTAANVTLLQMRVADELKLRVLRPGDSSKLVAVESMEIGNARFRDLVVGARAWDEKIDGVLGFNVFANCLITMDYPAQTLEMRNGALPVADGATVFRYGLDNRSPTLEMTVGKTRMTMLLDTGAVQSIVLSEKDAAKLEFRSALKTGSQLWTFDTGKTHARVGRLAGDVVFGASRVKEPTVHVSGEDPPLIGSDFLEDFVITFDQRNQTVSIVRGRK